MTMREQRWVDGIIFGFAMAALFGIATAFLFNNLWWLGIPLGVHLTLKALYYEPKE